MIRIVHLWNKYDVNKRLCSAHFLFRDGSILLQEVGLNINNIILEISIVKFHQYKKFLNMETQVLKIFLP
jgi:hypothetical protein